MGYEVAIGAVVAAVIAATSTYISSSTQAAAQRQQQEYEAAVARNNAIAMQQQAENERQKGQIAQANLIREQEDIRTNFEYQQGNNISLLAAGNLDISSGSAAAALEGNINKFSDDIAWNEYQQELALWEAEENAKYYEFQAGSLDSQSSYLTSTASSLGPSLLSAGMAGVAAGASAYSSGGGTFGSTTTTSVTNAKSAYFNK